MFSVYYTFFENTIKSDEIGSIAILFLKVKHKIRVPRQESFDI